MKLSLSSAVGKALPVFLIPLSSASGATFMGLGDLPGGDFQSDATAISADGTVVGGRGISESGTVGFRWKINQGICIA